MDQIKEAFQKVKYDMDVMKEEILSLNQFLAQNTELLSALQKQVDNLSFQITEINQKNKLERASSSIYIPTNNPTKTGQNPAIPTDIPAQNDPFKALNTQNLTLSTGNQGVPTDRQTNQQTNQQTQNPSFDAALEVLNSLDSLKKEIRNKFKRITEQEFLVFSTIYQMEEEGEVDYKAISQKLNLTESSIRDYVGKLIKKGIPVEKTKINNKLIQLSISKNLKKIAPLPIILQLREL